MWEESLQCLSLLVRLYGGAAEDCLTRSCLQSFLHVLRTHLQDEATRSTLEIINRLVNTHISVGQYCIILWAARKRYIPEEPEHNKPSKH